MNGPIDRIAAAVAAHGLVGDDPRWPSQPLEPAAWVELTQVCLHERLICLLDDAVRSTSMPATAAQRRQLAALGQQLVALQLDLEGRLLRVTATLDRNGLDYRVLKGAALANSVYDHPRQRHFHDIDLLARADQIDAVVRVMTAQASYQRRFPELRPGFDRRYAKSVTMIGSNDSELDIHRVLVRGVCGFALDLDGLWESPRLVTVGGITLPALSPSVQLLHAALGAAVSDVPPRLSMLRDVAQLVTVDGADAIGLERLATRHGVTVAVSHGILLTERVLAVPLGAVGTWARSIDIDADGQRQLTEYRAGDQFRRQALDIARTLPWRDRFRYLGAMMVPSRAFLEAREVSRIGWLRGTR